MAFGAHFTLANRSVKDLNLLFEYALLAWISSSNLANPWDARVQSATHLLHKVAVTHTFTLNVPYVYAASTLI